MAPKMTNGTDLASVYSVYSGRPGCACGCRGKYSYASAHRAYASKNRGHDVSDDEVSDRSVKRIYNKVMNDPASVVDGNMVYLETETRVYVVHFVAI